MLLAGQAIENAQKILSIRPARPRVMPLASKLDRPDGRLTYPRIERKLQSVR